MSYIWLHQVTYKITMGYISLGLGLHVITVGYMWLQWAICGYNELHVVTCGHTRLHVVTMVTMGYMWLQWVTCDYRFHVVTLG